MCRGLIPRRTHHPSQLTTNMLFVRPILLVTLAFLKLSYGGGRTSKLSWIKSFCNSGTWCLKDGGSYAWSKAIHTTDKWLLVVASENRADSIKMLLPSIKVTVHCHCSKFVFPLAKVEGRDSKDKKASHTTAPTTQKRSKPERNTGRLLASFYHRLVQYYRTIMVVTFSYSYHWELIWWSQMLDAAWCMVQVGW